MRSLLSLLVVWFLAGSGALAQTRFFELSGIGNDSFGRGVQAAGDVNGDGLADVIVGAPQGYPSGGATGPGYAEVRSGRDGSVLFSWKGGLNGDNFGWAVAGVGDLDQDGHPELLVGAPVEIGSPRKPYARVLSGKTGAMLSKLTGSGGDDHFGISVAAAGDVNQDGYPDLIVGASFGDAGGTDSGSAYVFSGKDGSILHRFDGNSKLDYFGQAVAGAGDVNGDGFADLIAGADWDDQPLDKSGSATVFSGKDGSVLHAFVGDGQDDGFGRSVSTAGDLDQDGFADFTVGAPESEFGGGDPGYVRVFSGKTGAILHDLTGDARSMDFGEGVSTIGDLDHDGIPEIVVGDFRDATFGADSGAAWVFSGASGAVIYRVFGEYAYSGFGQSLAGCGDVNGDGADELVVGAYNACESTVYSGKPYPASSSAYGSGWPGTHLTPTLQLEDLPIICEPARFKITNSLGAPTTGLLIVGLAPASLPTEFDGTLNVLPAFVTPISLPTGGLTTTIDTPCDTTVCGMDAYVQVIEFDAGASKGLSFTAGLAILIGGEG